eukprot:scaffold253909_cov36-Tisochrysis_lutea.AAC.1
MGSLLSSSPTACGRREASDTRKRPPAGVVCEGDEDGHVHVDARSVGNGDGDAVNTEVKRQIRKRNS